MTANRYLFKGNDWTGILLWIRTHVCAWYEGLKNWLGALGRSLPEGYNYRFDYRETATSCAF